MPTPHLALSVRSRLSATDVYVRIRYRWSAGDAPEIDGPPPHEHLHLDTRAITIFTIGLSIVYMARESFTCRVRYVFGWFHSRYSKSFQGRCWPQVVVFRHRPPAYRHDARRCPPTGGCTPDGIDPTPSLRDFATGRYSGWATTKLVCNSFQ